MTISIQLPSDVETRLAHLADLTGRSKTFYVREAVLEYLDDLEDLYLGKCMKQVDQGDFSDTTTARP